MSDDSTKESTSLDHQLFFMAEKMPDMVEKNLDIVLKNAQLEYQHVVYSTWSTQCSKLHTFLWLSVAIISASIGFYLHLLNADYPCIISLRLMIFSILFEFISFLIGVMSMSGGNTMRPVYGTYEEYFIKIAEYDLSGYRIRKEAIIALEKCILAQIDQTYMLAKRMRLITFFNKLSISFTLLSVIVFFNSNF